MNWLTEFLELGRRDLRDFRKSIDQGFKDFTRTYGEDIESFFEPLLQFLIWLEKLLPCHTLACFHPRCRGSCLVRESKSQGCDRVGR